MTLQRPFGTELHVVLGMTEPEYERALIEGRATVGWEGLSVDREPRWHSHPVLGITGHAHGPSVVVARSPHTHMPEVEWGPAVSL